MDKVIAGFIQIFWYWEASFYLKNTIIFKNLDMFRILFMRLYCIFEEALFKCSEFDYILNQSGTRLLMLANLSYLTAFV